MEANITGQADEVGPKEFFERPDLRSAKIVGIFVGINYPFDYSKDMEYLEVAGPVDFGTVDVRGPCDVPAVTPWT